MDAHDVEAWQGVLRLTLRDLRDALADLAATAPDVEYDDTYETLLRALAPTEREALWDLATATWTLLSSLVTAGQLIHVTERGAAQPASEF